MTTILIMGVILIVGGVLFLMKPSVIDKLNQMGQQFVFGEGGVSKHRIQTGILLMLTGLLMFVMYLKWGN
ncbi:MAG: hypothetical protein ABH868_02600 [bacterium]